MPAAGGARRLQVARTTICSKNSRCLKQGGAFTARANGKWSDPDTWDMGAVPSPGSRVTIPAAYTVSLDSSEDIELATLQVRCKGVWDSDVLSQSNRSAHGIGSFWALVTAAITRGAAAWMRVL